MMLKKRNGTLDIMKFFLIVLVIVTHYEWTTDERLNPAFPFLIDMAVPAFMIITGYVYTLSMDRKQIETIGDAYRYQVLLPRIVRYIIPYAIVIIWELLDPNITLPTSSIESLRYIINGTSGKGSYYVPVMIQIVFIFPILYFVFRRYGGGESIDNMLDSKCFI